MPGLFDATASAYHPTLRDRAATGLLGLLGNPNPNSATGHLVGGLLGSYGAGSTGQMSLADFLPFFQADEAGRQMASGHPLFGAANLAMALPLPVAKGAQMAKGLFGGAGRKAVEEAAQAAEKAAPIIAYHGSPHQFDKFDAAKIGTGEGAQAYGHGLYFAENEKTARAYRDNLTANQVDDGSSQFLPSETAAFRALRMADGDHAAAIADLQTNLRQATKEWQRASATGHPAADHLNGQVWKYEDAIQHVRDGIKPPGSMYQVGINAHPDHFLDWDKPLSEQHPHVQEAVRSVFDPYDDQMGSSVATSLGLTEVHKRGLPTTQAQVAAAQKLQEAGIPGIKYLDQGSRSAGDGTRNYVVFDPNHVDILKRYGIPATVFGGAGAAAAASQQPQPEQPQQGYY